MLMLAIQTSKERDAADWQNLFRATDSRYRLVDIKKLPAGMGLVEVIRDG